MFHLNYLRGVEFHFFPPLFESLLCLTKRSGTFVKRVDIWSDLFMPRFNNLKSTYGAIQSFFSRGMEEIFNIATECLTAQFSNTWTTQRHFSAFMFNLSHLQSIYTRCLKARLLYFLSIKPGSFLYIIWPLKWQNNKIQKPKEYICWGDRNITLWFNSTF